MPRAVNSKHISILLLLYNGEKYINDAYVGSIIKNTKVPGYAIDFVFLDNGSTDNTVSKVLKQYPMVHLLKTFKNTLYGEGVNTLIRYAYRTYKSDYFIIFDQDAKAPAGYASALVQFATQHPEAAFVQPLILNGPKNNDIYSAGHRYVGKTKSCFPLQHTKPHRRYSEIKSGSIMGTLLKAEAVKEVGVLDPIFEIYYESSDWCFRFRKAGYKCYCLYEAIVYHERDQKKSSNLQLYYVFRNKIILWAKHDTATYQACRAEYQRELDSLTTAYSTGRLVNNSYDQMKHFALSDGVALAAQATRKRNTSIKFQPFSCVHAK
ncbi:MAG: glycosyltransferase family 2 protein [Candidatus Doudnabacteria bacterium]|nr:glycosyltransferase family 2 protein [Candidatus Doudnabacteria bacterium]